MTQADPEGAKLSTMQIVGAASKFLDEFVEATGDATMPVQQVRMLLAIYMNREMMQTELPKYVGIAGASISRNLDRLGRNGPGWVMTKQDEHHRKFNTVEITAVGKTMVDGVARKVARHFNRP